MESGSWNALKKTPVPEALWDGQQLVQAEDLRKREESIHRMPDDTRSMGTGRINACFKFSIPIQTLLFGYVLCNLLLISGADSTMFCRRLGIKKRQSPGHKGGKPDNRLRHPGSPAIGAE